MRIILVGGCKKTWFLTKSFLDQHNMVTIINKDMAFCKKIAGAYHVDVINGDGTIPSVLEDAGVKKADMVVAMSPQDSENLVICRLCGEQYKVRKTVAIINNPENVEVFRKLGVDNTISSISLISQAIEESVFAAKA